MNPTHRPGDGYWIAPTGHVLRLNTRHIVAVCERPEAFGISKPELEDLFAAKNEAWATEQCAREIVIKALVTQAAWIRVRHYHQRHGYWSINMPSLDSEQRAKVGAFFRLLGDSTDPDDQIRLDAPEDREWTLVRSSVQECVLALEPLAYVVDINDLPISLPTIRLPIGP